MTSKNLYKIYYIRTYDFFFKFVHMISFFINFVNTYILWTHISASNNFYVIALNESIIIVTSKHCENIYHIKL